MDRIWPFPKKKLVYVVQFSPMKTALKPDTDKPKHIKWFQMLVHIFYTM